MSLTCARLSSWPSEDSFTTTPNPRVGCVIVREQQVVGQAGMFALVSPTQRFTPWRGWRGSSWGHGLHHPGALQSHWTHRPCSQALIQAGVASVVAAMEDPNPQVSGQGLASFVPQA